MLDKEKMIKALVTTMNGKTLFEADKEQFSFPRLFIDDIPVNNVMIVKNCRANEIITLHGKTKMIESSLAGHTKLYNDFNYNFIRIINTFDNNVNTFTSTLPCEITISYSPIRKVGLIVW